MRPNKVLIEVAWPFQGWPFKYTSAVYSRAYHPQLRLLQVFSLFNCDYNFLNFYIYLRITFLSLWGQEKLDRAKEFPMLVYVLFVLSTVADPGGRGDHDPPPPRPVKISHKKDGCQRRPHRFHVSQIPIPGHWIRYWLPSTHKLIPIGQW